MKSALLNNLSGNTPDVMAPFLWLHWEDDSSIVQEIEKIYETGIRAVCIESRTHDDFCGNGWWEDVELILKECRKRNMKLWILDDKHFPSGYANGAFEEKYKHLRNWEILERHVDVVGPVKEGCVMSEAWRWVPDEDEIVGIFACKRVPDTNALTGEIIDITQNQHDGMVYFDLPEGAFRIFFLVKTRFYMRDYRKVYGDALNPAATDVFIKEVYEKHFERFGEYFGNTLLGFFSDEPCFGNNQKRKFTSAMGEPFASYPWSDDVLERLREIYGVNAEKKLIGLWYDLADESSSIRINYMNTITNMYSENFNKRIADWCHAHGVMYIGHIIEDNNAHALTGAGPGHYFRSLRWQDMSGIDVVLQQLVPGLTEHSINCCTIYAHTDHKFFNYILAKLGSSAAHLEAHKQDRAMCEIFGAYGWAEDTKIMKWLADHMMVRGINYFVPHAFSPKDNDADCPPNFYAHGKNPQYPYFKEIIGYMDRTLHILSGGVHRASCLVLYDAEAMWTGKNYCDDADVAKNLYDNQIDYDLIPSEYLDWIEEKDGKAVLNLESYYAVVIPYAEYLSQETVGRIKTLLEKGIRVVFADGVADAVQAQLNSAVETVPTDRVGEYMRKQGFADVSVRTQNSEKDLYLRFLHKSFKDQEVYYFVNEATDHTIRAYITLRGFNGGEYIVYDALSNQAERKHSDNGEAFLSIPAYQSVMLILPNAVTGKLPEPLQSIGVQESYEPVDQLVYDGNFRVSLKNTGIDEEYRFYKEIDQLESITGRKGIPGFSGDIKYEFTINAHPMDRCVLSLGNIGGAVSLIVNGKPAGVKVIPPFEFDIQNLIEEGENKVEVIVSNHLGYRMRDNFSRYLLFEPSGMLGPVCMMYFKLKEKPSVFQD